MKLVILILAIAMTGCASAERKIVRAINDHNTEGRTLYREDEDGTLHFVECWDELKYIGVYRRDRTSELYGPIDICTGIPGRPPKKKDFREQEDDTEEG